MERRARRDSAIVQVSERQQVFEPVLTILSEATVSHRRQRVLVGSKHHVEHREIRVVVRVIAPLVMDTMRLWSLEDRTKPVWGANVPMVEELRYSGNRSVEHRRLHGNPEKRVRDRGAEN